MVQIQDYDGKRADDRLRIGHLRVGSASPSVSSYVKDNQILVFIIFCKYIIQGFANEVG